MTTIAVTEDHIRRGLRGSASTCIVSLALQDAGFKLPIVVPLRDYVCITWGADEYVDEHADVMDPALAGLLNAWDTDATVQPRRFSFELPEPHMQERGPVLRGDAIACAMASSMRGRLHPPEKTSTAEPRLPTRVGSPKRVPSK